MNDNEKKPTITGDETFDEILKKYPETIPVFFQFGLHCIGCHISAYESIKDGAIAHGVEVDKLIEALNKVISKQVKA